MACKAWQQTRPRRQQQRHPRPFGARGLRQLSREPRQNRAFRLWVSLAVGAHAGASGTRGAPSPRPLQSRGFVSFLCEVPGRSGAVKRRLFLFCSMAETGGLQEQLLGFLGGGGGICPHLAGLWLLLKEQLWWPALRSGSLWTGDRTAIPLRPRVFPQEQHFRSEARIRYGSFAASLGAPLAFAASRAPPRGMWLCSCCSTTAQLSTPSVLATRAVVAGFDRSKRANLQPKGRQIR